MDRGKLYLPEFDVGSLVIRATAYCAVILGSIHALS